MPNPEIIAIIMKCKCQSKIPHRYQDEQIKIYGECVTLTPGGERRRNIPIPNRDNFAMVITQIMQLAE